MARTVWKQVSGKQNKGIGDYVHARLENYRLYGINRTQEGHTSINAQQALEESHRTLKNLIRVRDNKIDATIIEKYLTGFFYPNSRTLVENDVLNAQNQDLSRELQAVMEEKLPLLETDINNLSIDPLGKTLDSQLSKIYQYMGVKAKTRAVKRSTLKKLVKDGLGSVKQNLRLLLRNLQMSRTRMKAIVDTLKKIDSYSQQLYQYIDHYIDPDGISTSRPIPLKNESGDLTQLGALIKEINHFNKVSLLPTKKDVGNVGEIGIAYALGVAGLSADSTAQDLVYTNLINNKTIIGNQKSKTVYNRSSRFLYLDVVTAEMNSFDSARQWNIDKRKGLNKKISYEYDTDSRSMVSVQGSQDTVDIAITLAPGSFLNEQLGGLTQLYASIKNYDNIDGRDGKGVHILDGVPLLALLELTTTDFVNHYLNLLAFDLPTGTYQEEIAYAGAVRGLTGLRGLEHTYTEAGNETLYSDCFIVNSRQDERVFVFATRELLSQLDRIGNRSFISMKPQEFTPYTAADNVWIKINNSNDNDYAGAAMRISKLVAKLHRIKLQFSITNLRNFSSR